MKEFSVRIEQDYRVHWVMDNLPSATKYVDETMPSKPVTIYDLGFPLGFKGSADIPGTQEGVGYLNNHLLIRSSTTPTRASGRADRRLRDRAVVDQALVLGRVEERRHAARDAAARRRRRRSRSTSRARWCSRTTKWGARRSSGRPLGHVPAHRRRADPLVLDRQLADDRPLPLGNGGDDHDAHAPPRLHARRPPPVQCDRGVRRNGGGDGWKLANDVFRPPALPMLLSVFVGTGVQTLAMSIITMCFACSASSRPPTAAG